MVGSCSRWETVVQERVQYSGERLWSKFLTLSLFEAVTSAVIADLVNPLILVAGKPRAEQIDMDPRRKEGGKVHTLGGRDRGKKRAM